MHIFSCLTSIYCYPFLTNAIFFQYASAKQPSVNSVTYIASLYVTQNNPRHNCSKVNHCCPIRFLP